MILHLIAEKPRHGYELIKAIEERVGGAYSPSPGVIYPTLTLLEELGYVTAGTGEGAGAKKLPIVTGQDAELASVKSIIAGEQTQTVYKDTRELAKVAVQMTDAQLSGGKPEVNDTKQYNNGVKVVPSYLLDPVSVDKANYEQVLVEGGYYKASDLG